EYVDDHGHCQTCEASCAKCRGPTQEDCTTCPMTRILDDGRCVSNCPSWKFEFENQCHPCHHTCQRCQGSGPTHCTSCEADNYGREYFLYQGECRDSCPEGHYATEGNICLPCPDNCELCHSMHVCTRCTRGYFIAPTNHTCQKLECGQGEVQDPDYEECVPCEEGCLGCSLEKETMAPFPLVVNKLVGLTDQQPHFRCLRLSLSLASQGDTFGRLTVNKLKQRNA
ncbi:hypothetical protein H8959_012262, partial [Pygathrix nigripes]